LKQNSVQLSQASKNFSVKQLLKSCFFVVFHYRLRSSLGRLQEAVSQHDVGGRHLFCASSSLLYICPGAKQQKELASTCHIAFPPVMMPAPSFQNTPLSAAAAVLALVFAAMLIRIIVPIPRLFSKRIGRRHAQTGLAYLTWLAVGFLSTIFMTVNTATAVAYDAVLATLGISLTLTAAHEFGHKNVRNRASGTLDEDATVTYDEMIEHAFYQGLNLFQVRGLCQR
jgi:hypothetical protein